MKFHDKNKIYHKIQKCRRCDTEWEITEDDLRLMTFFLLTVDRRKDWTAYGLTCQHCGHDFEAQHY